MKRMLPFREDYQEREFLLIDETQPKEGVGGIFHLALTLIIPYDEKISSVLSEKESKNLSF